MLFRFSQVVIITTISTLRNTFRIFSSGDYIKRLCKFEKIDYRLRKAELNLEFLVKCGDNNIIPKFLNFQLANRSLRFSLTYAHCQSNLLFEEIRLKKQNVGILRKEFDNLRSSLQQQINLTD